MAVTRWLAEHQVRLARLAGKHGPSLVEIEHTLCEVHKYAHEVDGGYAMRARFLRTLRAPTCASCASTCTDRHSTQSSTDWAGWNPEYTRKRYLVAQLLGKRKAEDPEDKEEYLVDWLVRKKIVPGNLLGRCRGMGWRWLKRSRLPVRRERRRS